MLVRARYAAGDRAAAASLAASAERHARSIHDPHQRLVGIASTRSAIGDHDGAVTVVSSIVEPCRRGRSVAALAEKLAEAGCHNLAEQLARSITAPRWRAQALAALALWAATQRRRKRAKALTEQAHGMVDRVADPAAQVRILVTLASAMTVCDCPDRVAALAQQAEATASRIHEAGERAQATDLLTRGRPPDAGVRGRGSRRPQAVPPVREAGRRVDPAGQQQGLARRRATQPGTDRYDGRPGRLGLCHRLGDERPEAEGGPAAGGQQSHRRSRQREHQRDRMD
jgi:hypothetical protein